MTEPDPIWRFAYWRWLLGGLGLLVQLVVLRPSFSWPLVLVLISVAGLITGGIIGMVRIFRR
jgi:hypothetical protein